MVSLHRGEDMSGVSWGRLVIFDNLLGILRADNMKVPKRPDALVREANGMLELEVHHPEAGRRFGRHVEAPPPCRVDLEVYKEQTEECCHQVWAGIHGCCYCIEDKRYCPRQEAKAVPVKPVTKNIQTTPKDMMKAV